MKKIYPIVWLLACITLICSCTDEDLVRNADGIYLRMPDIQISDLPTEVISRADGDVKYVDFNTVENVKLYLTLDEEKDTRSTVFEYKDSKWEARTPLMVSGGARTYKAKLAAEVTTTSGTTFYAYSTDDISVSADGKFSATLEIYTTRVQVVLKDKNDTEVDGYTIEYTGFPTTGLSVTDNVVNWEDDNSRPKYTTDTQTPSGDSPTATIDHIVPRTISSSENTTLFTIKKGQTTIATVKYSGDEQITLEEGYSYIFNIKLGEKEILITDEDIVKPQWVEGTIPIDIKTKGLTQLTYDKTSNTYTVSGAYGLMYLQQWMNSGAEEQPCTDAENVLDKDRMDVNITLADNIDMSVLPDQSVTINSATYSSKHWKPIGSSTPYTGTFNGNGYSIKNLSCMEGEEPCLVGTNGGVIKSLIIDAATVKFVNINQSKATLIACANQSASVPLVETNDGNIISSYTSYEKIAETGSGNIAYSYHSAKANGATSQNRIRYSGGLYQNNWSVTENSTYPIALDMNRGIAEYNQFVTENTASVAKSWNEVSEMPSLTDGAPKWYMEFEKVHYKTPLSNVGTNNFEVKESTGNAVVGYEAGDLAGLKAWNEKAKEEKTDGDLNYFDFDLYLNSNINITASSDITQVGNATSPYVGTINGDDYTISELVINQTEVDDNGVIRSKTGFIGMLGQNGVVENLKVKATVTGGSHMGAVVGFNEGGRISNCETLEGTTVTADNGTMVGGVVGYNHLGIVENCVNRATVKAEGTQSKYTGGVVGENFRRDWCIVRNCENYGNVEGYENVGGVIGINHRILIDCHNKGGTVTGVLQVGGVVGLNNDASPYAEDPGWPIYVINCTNTQDVSGLNAVGGVAGRNGVATGSSGGYIIGCWNSGAVSTRAETVDGVNIEYYGGVVGLNDFHLWSTQESTPSNAILGNRYSQIIACYNTGSVTASAGVNYVGGVAGRNVGNAEDEKGGSTIYACYWSSENDRGVGVAVSPDVDNVKTSPEVTKITNNDWSASVAAMNAAIDSYISGTYGVVEWPSQAPDITKQVKKFVSQNPPVLEE